MRADSRAKYLLDVLLIWFSVFPLNLTGISLDCLDNKMLVVINIGTILRYGQMSQCNDVH